MGRKNHSDPLWDTRRRRLDISLAASFGIIILAIQKGPETATAVVGPAFVFLALVLPAYMGIAEWGRFKSGATAGKVEE